MDNMVAAIKYMKYLPQIIQIVVSVEGILGPGTGAEKKEKALKLVAALIATVEGIAEKDLVDNDAMMRLADTMIELAVKLMNLQPEVEKVASEIRDLNPNASTRP